MGVGVGVVVESPLVSGGGWLASAGDDGLFSFRGLGAEGGEGIVILFRFADEGDFELELIVGSFLG